MKKIIPSIALGVMLAGASLAVGPDVAEASASGYLCYAAYVPLRDNVASYGDSGYIAATIYSGAACTGTFQGNFYAYTTGSTQGTADDQRYAYDREGLAALSQNLQRATESGQRVYMVSSAALSPNVYRIKYVMFYSD